MTKENIYKSYLEDPLLVEKSYVTAEKAAKLRLIDPTEVKLLEVIKLAIKESVDGESDTIIVRKINKLLSNTQL
jgi:hypothetical protein